MKDLQELTKVNEESLPKLYCDMDQVLVAFLSGVKKISGQDFDKVWKDSDRDYWMTAEEAKAYGMIDEVLERKK